MADTQAFIEALKKNQVPADIIEKILNVGYQKDSDEGQENANYYAKAMPKAIELLGFERTAQVMFGRACCKTGYRLTNARNLSKGHGSSSLKEKLEILGTLKNMGHPFLNVDGDIETVAVGEYGLTNMTCPCWRLKGRRPTGEKMPLEYCLCCAGHFRFHYQKALDLELKVKKVASSIVNSEGKEPCVFIYEIAR